jgi:hypothetical protein
MKCTPLSVDANSRSAGFVLDLDSVFAALCMLGDARDARGLRYALVNVLIFILLAKLAGQDHLRGVAQWVKLRKERLADALGLAKAQAPHATTYSRALRHAIDIEEFERVVREFFAGLPQAGESISVAIDGKTLRGTIPAGQSRGVHLLAVYLPEEGWVLLQVVVEGHENEVPAARRVVGTLDLRSKIVTGDALLTHRELSVEIVE